MNAAVLVTIIVGQIAWGWISPHVLPKPAPIAVVVVGTEAPHVPMHDVASNAH